VSNRQLLNAKFIVKDRLAQSDVLKICVKRKVALNVRLFVLQLNATPNVWHQSPVAILYAKKLDATGNARNPQLAQNQNVNSNVKDPLVNLVPKPLLLQLVAHASRITPGLLIIQPVLQMIPLYFHPFWRLFTLLNYKQVWEMPLVVLASPLT